MIYFKPSCFAWPPRPQGGFSLKPIPAFYRSLAAGNPGRALQDFMAGSLTAADLNLLRPLQAGFACLHSKNEVSMAGSLGDISAYRERGLPARSLWAQTMLGSLIAEHHSTFQMLTRTLQSADNPAGRTIFAECDSVLDEVRSYLNPTGRRGMAPGELAWSIDHFDNFTEVGRSVGRTQPTIQVAVSRAKSRDPEIRRALTLRNLRLRHQQQVYRVPGAYMYNLTDDRTHLQGLALILGAELLAQHGTYSAEIRERFIDETVARNLADVLFVTGFPDAPFNDYTVSSTIQILRQIWHFQQWRDHVRSHTGVTLPT